MYLTCMYHIQSVIISPLLTIFIHLSLRTQPAYKLYGIVAKWNRRVAHSSRITRCTFLDLHLNSSKSTHSSALDWLLTFCPWKSSQSAQLSTFKPFERKILKVAQEVFCMKSDWKFADKRCVFAVLAGFTLFALRALSIKSIVLIRSSRQLQRYTAPTP